MSNRKKDGVSANYGILGNVTAKAVAVGPGATATSIERVADREDLVRVLRLLESGLQELNLSSDQMDVLREDVEKLKKLAGKSPELHSSATSIMTDFVAKLKMIGVVAQSVISLKDPLSKIASWFGITPPF